MTPPIIGIDLGTTFSCVGVFQHGKVEIIANEQGNMTTPSCVAFTDTERLIGEVAKDQAGRNPENTVFDAKRLIGRNFDHPEIKQDLELWPFQVVDDNGKPTFQVQYMGKTKRLSPQEISAMILAKMKTMAEEYLSTKVTDAVITVPAYFNDSQRQGTKDAATIAGLNVRRIINEPTAAALAYSLDTKLGGEKNVLVFDLGGGTFDVSILTVTEKKLKVLATNGNTHLGGEDFDNRLVKHFANEFKRKENKDLRCSALALRKLKTACERAKHTLSSCAEARVEIESLYQGIHFSSRIHRARFEQLCADLFKSTLKTVQKALQDAKLDRASVDEIVLIGGSARIPKIRHLLQEYFDGKPLNLRINADEAVAYGAAVEAAVLAGDTNDAVKDLILVDVLPLSLGVALHGVTMGTMIKRNSIIPIRQHGKVTLCSNQQTTANIRVYEGESKMVMHNSLLGEFELTGLPAASAGEVKILVILEVDVNGILNVSAKEETTGNATEITIMNSKDRLGQHEILQIIHNAEKMEADEVAHKGLLAARDDLENCTYHVLEVLEEVSESDSVKKRVRAVCADIVCSLDSNPLIEREELKQRLQELREACGEVTRLLEACDDAIGEKS